MISHGAANRDFFHAFRVAKGRVRGNELDSEDAAAPRFVLSNSFRYRVQADAS